MSSLRTSPRPVALLRRGTRVAILAGAAISMAGCAADGVRPSLAAAPAMGDGGIVMPPGGWLDFCSRHQDDPACRAAELTPERARQLEQVQAAMRLLPTASDTARFGKAEFWEAADARGGDCEDFAIAARAQLLRMGWPRSALRLATAWTERNEFHLVLTVDVATGGQVATVVLDQRFPRIESWQRLRTIGYRFVSRQAAAGATWVRVLTPGKDARPSVRMASYRRPAEADTASVTPIAPRISQRDVEWVRNAPAIKLRPGVGSTWWRPASAIVVPASAVSRFAAISAGLPQPQMPGGTEVASAFTKSSAATAQIGVKPPA